MNVFIVEKCSNFTDGNGPMFVHRIFENLEDARNYIMQCDGIFGSEQCMHRSRRLDNGLLRETWNGYDISEYDVIPKQPEPEKNWRFRYKVFYLTDDKDQLFKLVNETEDEGKYLNAESAKIAADCILKNSNFQIRSFQKWQKHTDSNCEEIYAKNIYVTRDIMDKGEELYYQFQVYEVKNK
jgi:hypothetical protein